MRDVAGIYDDYVSGNYHEIQVRDVVDAARSQAREIEVRRHPLGFYHAELTPLTSAPIGERFWLHFWLDSSGSIDGLGDLHEHTWHLTSLVLAGRVIDSNLVATPAENGAYFGSRIVYAQTNSSAAAGRFDLVTVNTRQVEAGDSYEISSRTVHLNAIGALPTVTLVRSVEDQREDGPLVFSAVGANPGAATSSRPRVVSETIFDSLATALKLE